MMLQPTTTMTAQILTTSHSKNNTSHSKNNTRSSRHENDYNESASIKSASSNADHATNTEFKQANQYKSTTFDTTTTNAELMTQPNQDKENSYHTLVSLGIRKTWTIRRNHFERHRSAALVPRPSPATESGRISAAA